MEELIQTFHIDWKLIFAQLVNFGIVMFVLWRFALKPLMKTLDQRSLTIEKGLREAEEIERKLRETDVEVKQKVTEARAQALAILNESKKQAEEKRHEMLASTKKEVEQIISQAKEQIKQEKESIVDGARKELAHLISLGLSRVLQKSVDKKVDESYIKDHIKHLT